MRRSPTDLGRILTFVSIAIFVSLSFSLFLSPSPASPHSSSSLYKRTPARSPHAPPPGGPTDSATSTASDGQFPPDTLSSVSSSSFSSTSTVVVPTTTSTTPTTTTSQPLSSTSTSTTPTSTSTSTSTSRSTSSSTVKSKTTSRTPTIHPTTTSPAAPQTTFYATYSGYVPNVTTQAAIVPTTSAASSTGFWQNKGAVGATFTFVSLIGVGLFFAIGTMFLKRRRSARDNHDAYFEKYQEGTTDGHYEEPEPMVTEAMVPAPPDAYPDRQIHYGTAQSQESEHGIYPDSHVAGYLPSTDFPPQNVPQEHYYQGGSDSQAPHSSSHSRNDNLFYPTTHPFEPPQNSTPAGLAPPVAPALRQTPARHSGYDRSIDSFYGADDFAGHAM